MKLIQSLQTAVAALSLILTSCLGASASKVSATARGGTIFYRGGESMPVIDLKCKPYSPSGLVAKAEGYLMSVSKTASGYTIGGQIQLTVVEPGERTRNYTATVDGTYTPPDGRGTFRTNYLSVNLYGAGPMNALSISLEPESGDFPMSAAYRDDGYRFGMDCGGTIVK